MGVERKFFVTKPYPLLWLGEKKLEVRGLARLVRVVPGFLNEGGDNYYQYVARPLDFPERPEYWEALEEGWRISRWKPEIFVPGIYIVAGGVQPRAATVSEILTIQRGFEEVIEKTFNIKLLVPNGTGYRTNAIVLGDYEPSLEETPLELVVEYGVLCNPPEYVDLHTITEEEASLDEEAIVEEGF
jgi:hypothetical protein